MADLYYNISKFHQQMFNIRLSHQEKILYHFRFIWFYYVYVSIQKSYSNINLKILVFSSRFLKIFQVTNQTSICLSNNCNKRKLHLMINCISPVLSNLPFQLGELFSLTTSSSFSSLVLFDKRPKRLMLIVLTIFLENQYLKYWLFAQVLTIGTSSNNYLSHHTRLLSVFSFILLPLIVSIFLFIGKKQINYIWILFARDTDSHSIPLPPTYPLIAS